MQNEQIYQTHQCSLCGKIVESIAGNPTPPEGKCEYSTYRYTPKSTHNWGAPRILKNGQRLIRQES